jgi:hypothetical protein
VTELAFIVDNDHGHRAHASCFGHQSHARHGPYPGSLRYHWLYGFVASCVLYYVLNVVFPGRKTLIPNIIHGDTEVVKGVPSSDQSLDGNSSRPRKA